MIVSMLAAFALLLPLPAQIGPNVSGATATHSQELPPNIVYGEEVSIVTIDAEQTIAEFMTICLRPAFEFDRIEESVELSSLDYAEEDNRKFPFQRRWTSARAHLSVTRPSRPELSGHGLPSCEIVMGTSQPRTAAQLRAILKPALEAELGHEVIEQHSEGFLEWHDRQKPSFTHRVFLGTDGEASHVARFTYQVFSPEGWVRRQALIQEIEALQEEKGR